MKRWAVEWADQGSALRITLTERHGGDLMRLSESLSAIDIARSNINLLQWTRLLRRLLVARMGVARCRITIRSLALPMSM
jgi:hypothetical protein